MKQYYWNTYSTLKILSNYPKQILNVSDFNSLYYGRFVSVINKLFNCFDNESFNPWFAAGLGWGNVMGRSIIEKLQLSKYGSKLFTKIDKIYHLNN